MDVLLAREVQGRGRGRIEAQAEGRKASEAVCGGSDGDQEGDLVKKGGVDDRPGHAADRGEGECEIPFHAHLSVDVQVGLQGEGPQKEACQHRLHRGEAGFQKTNLELLRELPQGFAIVCLDESFFIYDSLVRRVWIEKGSRPVVTVTGSHRHSVLYGALSLDGKQLFRQYETFDGESFLDYLKLVHRKFGRCLLFLDKATQHQTEEVFSYFERHERTLVPIWEP